MQPQKLFKLTDLLPMRRTRIAELCRQGSIPGAVRIGQLWLISESDWTAYIGSRTVGAKKD